MPHSYSHALLLTLLLATTLASAEEKPKRDYRQAMRQFVQAISAQAKKRDPAFLVVPQGGVGLLTDKGKPSADYLNAIDGIGQEEIFYGFDNKDNRKTPKKETDSFLKQLAVVISAGKPVLLVEDDAIRVRYADDAEVFAGLIGVIRLPRDSSKGQKRRGRPRKIEANPYVRSPK